jgi:hypothetical protein
MRKSEAELVARVGEKLAAEEMKAALAEGAHFTHQDAVAFVRGVA